MNASRKFPQSRLRRTRFTSSIRNLVAENDLTVNDLIQPIFVKEGLDGLKPLIHCRVLIGMGSMR